MKSERKLKGLILSGGKSSRMGSDKGLMNTGGKTWAQEAVEKCRGLGIEALVSVNPTQYESYQCVLDKELLVVDHFEPLKGPLKGIMTAHKTEPDTDWMVFPVDMPLVSVQLLRNLMDSFFSNPGYEYYLMEDSVVQPFPGIYTSNALAWVYNFTFVRPVSNSLKSLFSDAKVLKIPCADNLSMLNFNTMEELHNNSQIHKK